MAASTVSRRKTASPEFWENVAKSDGCWEWQAALTVRGGYGQFSFRGRATGAHRVSWILTYGEIPKGLWVLHKCDNPKCVRPDHLFLGTAKDNMQDCARKGRTVQQREPERFAWGPMHHWYRNPEARPRGEAHGNAKLTADAVRDIRARHANGETCNAIAKDYKRNGSTVARIVRRESWRHVE